MRSRSRARAYVEANPPWLISFADMTTLILTFFVMLFSMLAVEQSVLSKLSLVQEAKPKATSKMPDHVRELLRLIAAASTPSAKLDKIKELLIPPEYLPPEVTRATLDANLKVLRHPEGLAVVLSDQLLFERNQGVLTPQAQRLLLPLAELLVFQRSNVIIAGFVDDGREGGGDPLKLSGRRALAVLDFFIRNGVQQERFSLSGYGATAPWRRDMTASAAAFNRRVEILLQTSPFFGGYQSF
jgi:chemotaxis protein MotB